MEYKYYNQFNLSNDLANAISHIISTKEEQEYSCQITNITIPEQKKVIYTKPEEQYQPHRWGFKVLGISEIIDDNERESSIKRVIVTAKKRYSYLTVMDQKSLEILSKFEFENEDGIKKVLDYLSACYFEYNGVFDAQKLIADFPYLKDFFYTLDEWRAKNNRITVDENILIDGINSVKGVELQKHK